MVARKRSQRSRKTGGRHASSGPKNQAPASPHSPWIYGVHAVAAAISNPQRKCQRLIAVSEIADTFQNAGVAVEIVGRQEIDSYLPPGAVHQGVALLASPLPALSVEDVAAHAAQHDRTLIVALDQVTDPQNVGAVLRSAAAFGAYALLVPDRHTPETSGALTKAASGAAETVPVIRPTNLVRALETLKSDGFWVVGLDVDAPQTLAEAELPDRCVLALGAEGRGLRRLTKETCDLMVNIPMSGAIQSLNVSASAAIALYEWARQPS